MSVTEPSDAVNAGMAKQTEGRRKAFWLVGWFDVLLALCTVPPALCTVMLALCTVLLALCTVLLALCTRPVQKIPNICDCAPVSRRRTLAIVVMCSVDFKLYFDTSHITSLSKILELRGLE